MSICDYILRSFSFLIHFIFCMLRLKDLSMGTTAFLTNALNLRWSVTSCTSLQSYIAHFTRGEVMELLLCSKSQKSFLSLNSDAFAQRFYSGYTGLRMMERYNWEKIVRTPVEKARMLWLYTSSEVFITICGIYDLQSEELQHFCFPLDQTHKKFIIWHS